MKNGAMFPEFFSEKNVRIDWCEAKAMRTKIGIESSEINLPKPSDTILPVRICW